MSTTAEIPDAIHPGRDPSRTPKKAKPRFIVTLNEVPCARASYSKTIIGRKLIPAGGTLVKNAARPELFKGEKSAEKAIKRAERLRNFLVGGVCGVADSHKQFAEPGEFKVKPFNPEA